MTAEVALTEDGERALGQAQTLCERTNVAIVAPEHLLAGALLVLLDDGATARLPARDVLEGAVLAAQGMSAEPLDARVMFGSAAREAINFTAAGVRNAGLTDITALAIAAGTIASGEVGPMFFSSLGTTREALLDLLRSGSTAAH